MGSNRILWDKQGNGLVFLGAFADQIRYMASICRILGNKTPYIVSQKSFHFSRETASKTGNSMVRRRIEAKIHENPPPSHRGSMKYHELSGWETEATKA
jgi:hypothetical protein